MKSKFPFIKFLIYLTIGYLVGYILPIETYFLIGISIFTLLISFFTKLNNNIKYLLLSLLIGISLQQNADLYRISNLEKSIPISFDGTFKGKITEVYSIKENYSRFNATGVIHSKIFKKPYNCNVIFILFHKNKFINLKPGYEFISNSKFRLGQPKILDEDFNEKSYLIGNKSLFYGTISQTNISVNSSKTNIKTYLYDLKAKIKQRIRNLIKDDIISGVIIALTTGDKSGVDKETQTDFSLTGTAHILAISGLHVGIFSLLIYTILGVVQNRLLRVFIFVVLVWAFVIFTGGQPSAIRAAIMATLFVYLIYYGKVPNPINILLSTIIVYIIIEPTIIYSISFQLSVLAISGIFILYKPIRNLILLILYKENSLTNFLASSLAISFAATIPTSFLTAYYFNSFSIIYPLANLLVLPLMTYASFQSIFFVIFSSIHLPFSDLFLKMAYASVNLSININTYLAELNERFNIKEVDLILLAIISSLVLLYVLISNSYRQLLFRLFVSSAAILLFISLPLTRNSEQIILLPREQFTGLIVQDDYKQYILISDRKKYDYLQNDIGLINYITNSNKPTLLLNTGNVSINLHDKVKNLNNIKSKFLALNQVDTISKRLHYNYLYNIIETYD